jgi:hypothetical protein
MKSKTCLFFFAVSVIFSCDPPKEQVKPIIQEGIYINEIYASGEDWVELYNDLTTSKDISNYFIYDDATNKYKIPIGTTIPAKGFLVFLCNDLSTGLNTNFKLSSSGETVFLENASSTLIDKITFPDLSGALSYGRFGDGSSTLAISGLPTKGISNGDSQAPAITLVERSPLVSTLNQPVTVTAKLVSTNNVASVKLLYKVNGSSFNTVTMNLSGSVYEGIIPAQSSVGKIEYYIEAKGTNNKISYEPSSAPAKLFSYLLNTDALPNLVINEFMAFNSACCPDVQGATQEFDDWIEIYNKGTVAVNIAGMYLSDNKSNPFNYKIPGDNPSLTTIPPGGFILLWADNSPSQGILHLDFGLNNLGEDVGLYYLDGRTIDEYTFGAQSENTSLGRTTNGAVTWKVFGTPTPGRSN